MPFTKKNRGGRKSSTRLALTNTRTPKSLPVADASDEEMADADVEMDVEDVRGATPQEELDPDVEDDEAATPMADDDDDEDDDDAQPQITTIPRRRGRAGRPRARVQHADTPEPGDDGSESGTPRRRRGRPPGRGGRGGGRGRGRGGRREDARQTVTDKNGTVLNVVDDEAQVDDDPEGNEKVDSKGHLQGGREYRVRTFTIMGKEERLYMLSTEPARCCGFRDSYLFFTKHPKLFKVVVGDEEKKDLIEREILPNSYKGRNIGVVTARSVFREFGAKIIVGGRKVIDDYKVEEARANGEIEGELADPDDHVPDKRDDYNRNRYVAWFGASEVYRVQAGGGTMPHTKQSLGKRKNNITLQNWQFMHAREASRFNTTLTSMRHANLDGVYDTNTNMMLFPKIMQPTHARWEQVQPESTSAEAKQITNGLTNGHRETNGTHDPAAADEAQESSIFSNVPPIISRNFTIVDTVYKAPPISAAGYPGPDGHVEDPTSGPNGLSSVPDSLLDELPTDCRAAFEEARAAEVGWKRHWDTEAHSGHRGCLKIGFNGYPV
ncbi:unnamed protein product [Zymoseptoria tritici ST99CH_1E4]|uniref:Chromatin structure-remodeling complex protein RSC7 n=1 Tax=Zymoseptoria tritici ST99CH_1E4 TaxID=1276532 RepID=A0A2H1G3E0_ZYMTR|nr:unnamed protein product [Zymoseptoria tritici ST99CH_1E4]